MGLQIPGELLEVQQTILVDVTLKDYLWGQRQTLSRSAGSMGWLTMHGAGGQGGGRFVEMRMCC